MAIYLDDCYQNYQCPVSILRYEKGDPQLKDYEPDRGAQLSARSLGMEF